jgi:MSHA pilin protein MshD
MKRMMNRHEHYQIGISLIELVMFIVIVSVGVVGILSVMNITTQNSADPMLRKQALSIAESLLEEIQLQPFTFCDPDDANVTTATAAVIGAAGCATTVEAAGIEPGETRYAIPLFDNVNDYHNFSLPAVPGIRDITGANVAGLAGYSATVTVVGTALGAIPAADSLLITVTVTPPSGAADNIVLNAYRTRYAPRSP